METMSSIFFRSSSPFLISTRSLPCFLSSRLIPFFLKADSRFSRRKCFSSYSAASSASPPPPAKILPSGDLKTISPSDSFLEWVSRTALCGNLTAGDVGKRVRLCGWVALHRIHGGVTFLNLRDHTGIVQITTHPVQFPEAHFTMNKLRLEYVVAVEGFVRSRPNESVNKKMKTGTIEVAAENVLVLNPVRSSLPFLVTTAADVHETATEEIRLRYRCLDLRRQQMHSNLVLRHRVVKLIRRYLEDVHDFVEIETPILSRSTPEGARDYLVPSRVQECSLLYPKVLSYSSKC